MHPRHSTLVDATTGGGGGAEWVQNQKLERKKKEERRNCILILFLFNLLPVADKRTNPPPGRGRGGGANSSILLEKWPLSDCPDLTALIISPHLLPVFIGFVDLELWLPLSFGFFWTLFDFFET